VIEKIMIQGVEADIIKEVEETPAEQIPTMEVVK